MTTEIIDVEQFRREARSWIGANLQGRADAETRRGSESKTPAEIAASRVLQRKFEVEVHGADRFGNGEHTGDCQLL